MTVKIFSDFINQLTYSRPICHNKFRLNFRLENGDV